MWGEGDIVPSIDELNLRFQKDALDERVCAMRFSIGAILFQRSFWEEMGHFAVRGGNGMGSDEVQLCQYCTVNNRPIMVSENVVVGHLSFGKQNETMKNYFMNNIELFSISNR